MLDDCDVGSVRIEFARHERLGNRATALLCVAVFFELCRLHGTRRFVSIDGSQYVRFVDQRPINTRRSGTEGSRWIH